MRLPKKTKEMTWTRVGESYVLLDIKTKENVTIDSIAFMVWVQCDGKTNLDNMTDVFSVDGNRDIVQAALRGILDKLKDSGLVAWED